MFVHTMAEGGFGLGVASEPNKIPENHPCWYADTGNRVVITWRDVGGYPMFSKIEKGDGYVAVKWGKMVVVGVYIPPKLQTIRYEAKLRKISACIRRNRSHPLIVAGDFNAHATLWGGRHTDRWGQAVMD